LTDKQGNNEMTRITLVAAAMLVACGSAFAGSDHFGSDNANQPVAAVDTMATGSYRRPDMVGYNGVKKTKVTTDSGATQNWPEPGQGIWGN
jgi:hypothetical protein